MAQNEIDVIITSFKFRSVCYSGMPLQKIGNKNIINCAFKNKFDLTYRRKTLNQ